MYCIILFVLFTPMLTSQQLELQEAILKRLYPWVSIEEAKKKSWSFDLLKHTLQKPFLLPN